MKLMMKMVVNVVTVFCISLSLLQTPCASLDIHELQSSHGNEIEVQIPTPSTKLSRKLKVAVHHQTPSVKEHEGESHHHQETMAESKQKMNLPEGNIPQKKESSVRKHKGGTKGTRQEWVEETDMSQYFTMDYGRIRRRRPIHNKSMPAP